MSAHLKLTLAHQMVLVLIPMDPIHANVTKDSLGTVLFVMWTSALYVKSGQHVTVVIVNAQVESLEQVSRVMHHLKQVAQ